MGMPEVAHYSICRGIHESCEIILVTVRRMIRLIVYVVKVKKEHGDGSYRSFLVSIFVESEVKRRAWLVVESSERWSG